MKEKRKNLLLWLSIPLAQIIALLIFWLSGPKLMLVYAIICLASAVMILFLTEDPTTAKVFAALLVGADVVLGILINSCFAGILVVDQNAKYQTIYTKSNYYVTVNNDTIPLEGKEFYVDNQTGRTLEIYYVVYRKTSNPYLGGGGVTDVIEPHTMKRVSTKPEYIFKSPPSSVRSKQNQESKSAIRFK